MRLLGLRGQRPNPLLPAVRGPGGAAVVSGGRGRDRSVDCDHVQRALVGAQRVQAVQGRPDHRDQGARRGVPRRDGVAASRHALARDVPVAVED